MNHADIDYDKGPFDRFKGWFWEERLIWICLYLILMQWNDALIPYWYEETIRMTDQMLTVMLYVGLIIPQFHKTRILIGLFVVYYAVFSKLVFMDAWIPPGGDLTWLERMQQLHPYIWLVGLIWISFEIFRKSVNSNGHIIFLLVLQMIVIGILDSFTADTLWDQAAWIMGASLLWLIALHFRGVRLRYNDSWSRPRRYALQMIASALVLMSLIISIGVSVPSMKPLLTDPYTSWIYSEKGSAGIGSGGKGSGIAGSAQSGYSVNDTSLGGGFDMDFTPVMSVKTDVRGYWRGESKSHYSGEGWTDGDQQKSTTQVRAGDILPQEFAPSENMARRTIKQTFTMLDNKKYPVIFGINAMKSFEITDKGAGNTNGIGITVWEPEDEELRYVSGASQPFPVSYTVESTVLEASDAELQAASVIRDDAFTAQKWEPYLQLPDNYSMRVEELAQSITAGATNNYDRAKRIEAYLRENYLYTNTPTLSLKQSSDFVDSFLFEIKEGYCDYFSSAMAIMLRTLDVPTRWAKGYAPGSREDLSNGLMPEDLIERLSDPTKGGTFRVTNADAHSWVEVYLGDYGWVSFEPTPGFSMPRLEPAEELEAKAKQRELLAQTEEEQRKAKANQLALPSWTGTAAKMILLLAVLFGLYVLFMRWRSVGFSMRWIRLYRHDLTFAQRIILETELWLGYCRIRGLRRNEGETVREAVSRWHGSEEQVLSGAVNIVHLFEQAKYGIVPMTDVDYKQMKEAIRKYKQTRKAA